MSALTSLLARDRIVPVSKIEEALQHQVLAGGDIETVLLEMSLVPEDVLSAYRAALFDRLPATREEVMRASRDAIRTLPRDLARNAGAIPLQLEGRTLVVAVAEPLSESSRGQISAVLGCDVSERIVTRPRLAVALSHHYGFELEPRMRRLADALRKREPGVIPFVRPPGPSLRPSAPATADAYSDNPFDERPDTLEYPAVQPVRFPTAQAPVGISLSEPSLKDAEAPDHAPVAVIPPAPRPVAGSLAQRFRLSTMPPTHVSTQIARAARGPLDEQRARDLLAQATQRDDVLFVLMRFAQQFFDFVGIFSLGKEGARGRMAHGVGLSPELMEHVIVPLEGSGLIARAVRARRVLIGDLSATDEERAAAALLGRPAGRPGVVVPVVLGSRAVLALYADRAGEGLSSEDAAAVAALVQPVADALRRIILEQKTLRRSSVPPPQQVSVVDTAPSNESAVADLPPGAVAPSNAPGIAPIDEPIAAARSPSVAPPYHASVAPPATRTGGVAAEPIRHAVFALEAVDLDRLSRAPVPRRETQRENAVTVEPLVRRATEGSRSRLQGIPRTAPPPPTRDSIVPPSTSGRADGSYHYVSPNGAILEEVTRPQRAQPQAQGPLGVQEVLAPTPAVGSAFAQVKPRRVEVEKSKTPVEAPPGAAVEAAAAEPTDEDAAVAAESGGTLEAPGEGTKSVARTMMSVPQPLVGASVIIDMGDQISSLVEGLLKTPFNEEPEQLADLVKVGEAALPVLLQRFPGPLWFDRTQPHKRRPRGRDVSAVARAIVAFGSKAAPYVASKVHSTDADTCFYALMLASEMPHADLLDAVARRALDGDAVIRELAIEVLRSFAFLPAFEQVLTAFAELSERPGKDPRRQRLAVEALGELRDRRSLNVLLPRLSDSTEATVQAAHRALVLLTCQDFGLAQRKWETWAEQWRSAHRVEWLIDSLLHSDEATRARAGDELKHATQQYFGYHPQLPKRDRELAQRKYREWWEREGRQTFNVA